MSKVAVVGAVALLASLALVPAASGASVHWVNDDEASPVAPGTSCTDAGYTTIAAAVAAAVAGDTIQVCEGAYPESVTINKALTLLGAQAGVPAGPDEVPAGRGAGESVVTGTGAQVFLVTAPATIDGFTLVSNPASTAASAVNLRNGSAGSTVVNNLMVFGAGGAPSGTSSGVFTQSFDSSLVGWNNMQGFRYAMNIDGGAEPGSTVDGNYMGGNTLDGVFVQSGVSTSHTFTGNTIEGSPNGLFVTQAHTITGNIVQNNGWGILLWGQTGRMIGAQVNENDVFDNVNSGIVLFNDHADNGDNEAHQNNFVGNGIGIENRFASALDAECNWYGSFTGPTHPDNPGGTGDSIDEDPGDIDYTPWLTGPAPGGACDGPVDLRTDKEELRDEVWSHRGENGGADDKEIEKATDALHQSANPIYWEDGAHLMDKDGKKVFDEEKKAVKELGKIGEPWADDVIQDILDIDETLAQTAIDEAPAGMERDKAEEEKAKGDAARADGDYDKAVDHYKKAWEHATKA